MALLQEISQASQRTLRHSMHTLLYKYLIYLYNNVCNDVTCAGMPVEISKKNTNICYLPVLIIFCCFYMIDFLYNSIKNSRFIYFFLPVFVYIIEIIDIECVLDDELCPHFFRACPYKSAILNFDQECKFTCYFAYIFYICLSQKYAKYVFSVGLHQ